MAFAILLVIGAGPAGLTAAVEAAEAGKHVWLVEQDFQAGGWHLSSGEASDLTWVQEMVNRFLAAGGVKITHHCFSVYMMGVSQVLLSVALTILTKNQTIHCAKSFTSCAQRRFCSQLALLKE